MGIRKPKIAATAAAPPILDAEVSDRRRSELDRLTDRSLAYLVGDRQANIVLARAGEGVFRVLFLAAVAVAEVPAPGTGIID